MRASRNIFAAVLAAFFLLDSGHLFARTLDEIRRSGRLVVAVSEQPTVYEKTGRDITGFHYRLAVLYARSLGVKVRFQVVNPRDFYKTDAYQFPLLFRDADLFVGRFRDQEEFRATVQSIPVYTALKVCLHRKRNPISGLADLPRLRLSALNWEKDPVVEAVEKKLGKPLPRQNASTVDDQVQALLSGTADYAFLDSDLAFVLANRNPSLSANVEVLKDVAVLRDVVWWTARQNSGLRQSAIDFLNGLMTGGDFGKIWDESYPLTFEEYREILGILEQKGDELFRKALDLAFNQKYAESLELFRSVRKMKLASGRFQRLYDTIYTDWISSERRNGQARQVAVLDSYMRAEPTEYFISSLRKGQPRLYNAYLSRLKQERQNNLEKKDYAQAVAVQSVIATLTPGPQAEKQIYDDIFISLLDDEEKRNPAGALNLLQQYLAEKPTPYFYSRFRTTLPTLYSDYRHQLRGELDNALRRGDAAGAVQVQERVLALDPKSFEESNLLARLKKSAAETASAPKGAPPVPAEEPEASPATILAVPAVPVSVLTNAGAETVAEQQVVTQGAAAVENFEGERYYALGVRFWNDKNYPEALENFRNARSLNVRRESCDDYISRIQAALDEERNRENREKVERFNRLFEQAIADYLQENYSRALENVLACLDIFPDNIQARTYSGIIADNLRVSGEKEIDPASPYFYYYLNRLGAGNRLIEAENYAGARAIFEELLILFPNNETARQKLAVCLYKQDPEALKRILREYFQSGQQLMKLRKTREAHLKFAFIRDMDPQYPGVQDLWEKTKTEQARPRTARGAASANRKSTGYEDMLRRAIALYEQGDLRGSLAQYRRILASHPDDYRAVVNASRIENQLNLQREGAAPEAGSAVRERAQNVYLKGQFYFRIRDYRQAVEFWEEAVRIDPSFRKALIDIRRVRKILADME